MERNGVDGDTAVRKVGGWAEATYAWAMTRSRGGVVAIATLERRWIANAHPYIIESARNDVACYSVMRVARAAVGGGVGDVHIRVRVEDLEETRGVVAIAVMQTIWGSK